MATLTNYNNNSLVSGTAENDSLVNHGSSNVTIDAGEGNDYIYNTGSSVTIDAGYGNDHISNHGNSVTINAGAGNDSIFNWSDSVTINAGDGDNYIYNYGSSVAIDAGDGDDTIYNGGDSVTIDGGAGADSINNGGGSSVTINAGDGNDSINNGGSSVTIDAGSGYDSIRNISSLVTIDAGDGNDSISNHGSNVTINAGDGNDSIVNRPIFKINEETGEYEQVTPSNNVTINGGAGDDTISLGSSVTGNVIEYNEGDGHDTIYGYNDDHTVRIDSSVGWSSVVSGNDIIVMVGDGSITLIDAAGSTPTTISGDSIISGDDTTSGGGDDTTSGGGDDTTSGGGDDTTSGGGDDTTSGGGDDTTSGGGDDTTSGGGDDTTSGGGDDTTSGGSTATGVATDVVFIIDKSGSMDDEIQRVKDAIASFANSLKNSGADFRFGIVEFGQYDNNGMPIAKTFTNFNGTTGYFTSDIDEFTNTLDTSTSGSDEYGLSAVQMALDMFQNDPRDAQKRIVTLTDEGYEENNSDSISTLTSTDIETALATAGVKMDVVGRVGTTCQKEWEPLANGTTGKFYDINNLGYYEYFEEIADDILGVSHVNINLAGVPEGTASGVFVVTTALNGAGETILTTSDATFKEAAEEGDYVVGNLTAEKNYSAVADSSWRQIISIPENWSVSATNLNDALNITGSNVTISGGAGNDNISIGQNVVDVTVKDISEIQNHNDLISFSTEITPGTLKQTTTDVGVLLYTESNSVSFTLPEISALDNDILSFEVSNAGNPNTIRELLYGDGNTGYNLKLAQQTLTFGRAHWLYEILRPDEISGEGSSANFPAASLEDITAQPPLIAENYQAPPIQSVINEGMREVGN